MRAAVAAFLTFLLLQAAPARAAEDLNVGFIVPLTGPSALMGQDALDGFLLGMKHIGGRPANVAVEVFTADQGKSREAIQSQAASMVATEKVRIIVAVTREAMEALVDPGSPGGPLVVAAEPAPAQLLGRQCSPGFFAVAGYADGTHETMGRHLQTAGFRRLAIIAPDTQRAREAAAAFRRGYTGPVVVEQYLRPGSMQHRDALRMLTTAQPDGVYSLLTGGMASSFIRQYAEAGLKDNVPYHAPAYALDQATIGALGEVGIDFESAANWSEDLDNPVNKRMVEDFRTTYGRWPTANAVWGYETAQLLDVSLKQIAGKHQDREGFRMALRRSEFASPRGTFKFQQNHAPADAYYLRAVGRNDRGKPSNRVRSTIMPAYKPAYASDCPMRWDPTLPSPVKK